MTDNYRLEDDETPLIELMRQLSATMPLIRVDWYNPADNTAGEYLTRDRNEADLEMSRRAEQGCEVTMKVGLPPA